MIRSEKKILKSLLKLSRQCDQEICYSPESNSFILVHDGSTPEISIPCPLDEHEILPVLKRLKEQNLIDLSIYITGSAYITLTFEAIHNFEFTFVKLWNAFFSKFIYGLISGVIIGTITTLFTEYLVELLAK